MASNVTAALAALHPDLPLLTPSDANFEVTRACFAKRDADVPFAIARPQNVQHVQALVQYCTKNAVDFVVRGGGHDCAGRSQVAGTLSIDLRDIKHVSVSADQKTATVGGGILFRDLAKELDSRGLITPVGTVASVGYVGWATLGGYGPFSTSHGLGVDQIVAAKVVNPKGELVEADAELLRGIRGGGGIFGVIVELTIKVYPLKELFTSLLIFESSDLKTAWTKYAEGYEKLAAAEPIPRALQLQLFGIELPGLGKVLAVAATWADADQSEGKRWFDKVAALGACIMNNPEAKTVSAFTAFNETLVVYGSYGRTYTANLAKYTPKTAEILAKYTASIPGGGIAIAVHSLRAPAPSEVDVFGSRYDHLMLEIVAMTPAQDIAEKGAVWALELIQELKDADPENVLDSSYVSLCGEHDSDNKKIYGVHYDKLVALKKKYDPDNVFKYAVPRLGL
ncbi:putative d-lactate dehydrogenase protein [Rosellinia necatrix]|uniref:Putative d-lactate dehydrogenase protein n=1 Tax=Rosellinia necatrix TaxID=77044 RepID=A0A1W2TWR0_ROSNE|nr:putative d-lactate dehydrogenase protein [Rosellinia necatrix]